MAYRGEQKIKGKTYVYQAVAQWDKDKKRSKQKRIYIGCKDEKTNDFIPNKKYYELYGGKPEASDTKTLQTIITVKDYGDVYLLDRIANERHVLSRYFSTKFIF